MQNSEAAEQSAMGRDGVSNSPLKGQKPQFDPSNNPTGMPSLKDMRNTGENKAGSKFLRDNMSGTQNGRESN